MAYSTISKPSLHFNTVTYSGNSSTNNITGVGFQPDWLWIKARNYAENHVLYDAVRGVTKQLYSNTSGAESTNATALTAFASDGFNLATANGNTNANGTNFVAWNWKAGTTFSNNAGANGADIASSGSINTTAGFSIIKATSDSAADKNIAHGLGVVPDVIFSKNLDSGYNWDIYFKTLGYNSALRLNSTNVGLTGRWGSSAFTTNTFQTKESYSSANGDEYIYYCFASKTGYSKFGSYTGNGNADGTFVYTGFKPAWILVKNSQQGGDHWYIWDNKRTEYNQIQKYLGPSRNNAEADSSSYAIDIMSNGFKIRSSTGAINNNGEKIVYMAFGQSLVGSNNVPATAF